MEVKIYLRSIVKKSKGNLAKDEVNCLAMFDSNRHGDINNLETEVSPGATVIWKLDQFSGISSITKICSKDRSGNIFKSDPVRGLKKEEFVLQISKTAKIGDIESYTIEYILTDKTKVIIDPFIKIVPPPPHD